MADMHAGSHDTICKQCSRLEQADESKATKHAICDKHLRVNARTCSQNQNMETHV